ncbi:MAG TPA: AAA family ATPase [Spirochaetota bacterium]|nr:AAA family ATPase [Spirochaetota bacterium]HPS85846.1 AAA family ATPase [Spirochaetota bacterium]
MKEILFSNEQIALYRESDRKGNSRRLTYELRTKYIKEEILQSFFSQMDKYTKINYEWLEFPEFEVSGHDVINISYFKSDKNLKNHMKNGGKIKVDAAITTLIDIAEKIYLLDESGLLNRIIKPDNILIGEKGTGLIFSPLNIVSDIRYGKNQIPESEFIINELRYTAPELLTYGEQPSDISSNIYSLGIIFYEILTGITPFQSEEADELIYSHQYRQPVNPVNLNQNLTQDVSDLVMKMIAKSRDDRYLTINGLIHDLKVCLKNLDRNSVNKNFILGQYDIPENLRVPTKLYGRDEAYSAIINSLESARKGSKQILFISGASGIGKTILIEKTVKPIVGDSVYFLSAKCEALKKGIPYSALINAFNHVIDLILLDPFEIQQIWRESIIEAIGDYGKIIVDMIPRFRELIGEPHPIPSLEGDENKNRMNMVLSRLVKVLTPPKQVLIIFIDDAQWIDSTSLSLIKFLISTGDIESLLFICSYRDNEITEFHNLKIFRDEIRGTVADAKDVMLKPLDIASINSIVSDSIRTSDQRVRELSELAVKFTGGNPLYIKEFLNNIYKKGILKFSSDKGWGWDNKQIIQIYETDSIIRTMINRMNEHSAAAVEILKHSSCIGSTFNVEFLSEVMGNSVDLIVDEIKPLIHDGYYRIKGNDYIFVHDKILEGASSLLTESEICRIHYKIGQSLLGKENTGGNDNYLFDIISHLTLSKPLLSQDEKLSLAALNVKAGEKAKGSYVYESALKYYYSAIEIIQEGGLICGEENHSYLQKLFTECFICEYMMDNMERSYNLFVELNSMAKTKAERVKIYTINCMLLFNSSKPEMAIEMGIKGLRILGIRIDKNPGYASIISEYVRYKKNTFTRNPETILEIKKLDNDDLLAAMELMFELWMPAYAYSHSLMKLLTLKMANITLENGLCHISPFAFMTFGIIYGTGKTKFKYGYKLGMLALRLNEIEKNVKMECILNYYFASFQSSWINHFNKSIPFFNKSNELGLQNGTIYYTALNRIFLIATRLIKGENLHEMKILCEEYQKDIKMNNDNPLFAAKAMDSIKKNIGLLVDYDNLSDSPFAERSFISDLKHGEVKQPLHWYYLFRAKADTVLSNFDEALKNIDSADQVVNWHFASPVIFEHLYIQSISILNSSQKRNLIRRISERIRLKRNMRYIKKCAKACPENFKHKYLLLKAENLKHSIFRYKALLYYNRAIDYAKMNNFVNDTAFVYECASKFYKQTGADDLHKNSIKLAYDNYKLWGADFKVKQLEHEYDFLIPEINESRITVSAGSESGALAGIIDELIKIRHERDIAVALEKISSLIFIRKIADRICFLISLRDKVMIKSDMTDGYFSFHNEPQVFTKARIIEEVFDQSGKGFNRDIRLISNLKDDGSPGSYSAAVIPFEQRGRVFSVLYLEKKMELFNEDEKRVMHTIAAFNSFLYDNIQDSAKRNIDVKKDSNTLNNVIMDRLMHKMNVEKVFLTEELTLPVLAREMGVTTPQLSEVINNYCNMNFNSFINKYRIEEAKKIFLENNEKTILHIAFEVGFNSLSVFYKAFIKFENMTPAGFRKLHGKEDQDIK